jgi:hypothetical protein
LDDSDTLVRQHDTTVMVVGPSGPNAERVSKALELARVRIVRVGSAPVACEKLAGAMPQVVILVAPVTQPSARGLLTDRADAVGAIVMEVDPRLEGDEYEDVVNDVITTAITRKMARDDMEPSSGHDSTRATARPRRDEGATDDDDHERGADDDGWE